MEWTFIVIRYKVRQNQTITLTELRCCIRIQKLHECIFSECLSPF